MENQAAWINAAKAHPLTVSSAPTSAPGPGEVQIKNAAWAINPVDWKFQDYDPLQHVYPRILGYDIAGEIASVAPGSRFEVGQRVMA